MHNPFLRLFFPVLGLIMLITTCSSAETVESKFKLKMYGTIRVDTHYDNAEVYKGDWMLFAYPGTDPRSKQNIFIITARHTQVGLSGEGPLIGADWQVKSKVELDFAGGFPNSSSAPTSPQLRLRLAYITIGNTNHELLIGQDWGLISAPFPNMANYIGGAGVGNFWTRVAQIRYTYSDAPIKTSIAVSRMIDANNAYNDNTNGDLDPIGDGERSGLPMLTGRVWYDFPAINLSAAGHYGQELVKDSSGTAHRMNSWSVIGTFKVPAGPVTFETKGFYGENVNSFAGGIFQGVIVDSSTVTNIKTCGGWAGLTYTFSDRWASAGGYSFDNPDDNVLLTGKRSMNSIIWLNLAFKPVPELKFIVEANYLKTEYKGGVAGDDVRGAFVTTYNF